MPVIECTGKDGKPGYKVHNTDGCPFTYESSNEESRKRAHDRASEQLRAIEAHKHGYGRSYHDVISEVSKNLGDNNG
jgi:hypothetical protein